MGSHYRDLMNNDGILEPPAPDQPKFLACPQKVKNNLSIRYQTVELPPSKEALGFTEECDRKYGEDASKFGRGGNKEESFDAGAINPDSLMNSFSNCNRILTVDEKQRLPKVRREFIEKQYDGPQSIEEPLDLKRVDHPSNLQLHEEVKSKLDSLPALNFVQHPTRAGRGSRVHLEGFTSKYMKVLKREVAPLPIAEHEGLPRQKLLPNSYIGDSNRLTYVE
mmetsp:Transcript_21906/g.34027  ORF Transcript_21906/g.34027 Transcript_21906/m.34027 type:complete len:222 (-) Transcript_21906:2429-3094(-)